MTYRALFILLFVPFIPLQGRAETLPQELSIDVKANSTCDNLELAFGIFGDHLVYEKSTVKDETGATILESESTHDPENATGSLERLLTVPAAAGKSSGYVAVNYTFYNGPKNSDASAASFLAIFDCANRRMLYSCPGNSIYCSAEIPRYEPRAEYNDDVFEYGTSYIGGDHDEEYVSITNMGIVGLQIKNVSIEGRDASAFRLEQNYNRTLADALLSFKEQARVDVDFIPKKRTGEYLATLRIETNDPTDPVRLIPMVAYALKRADLAIKFKNVTTIRSGENVVFDITLSVKNYGSKRSRKGKIVKVGLFDQNSCGYDSCNNYRGLIYKTVLPPLAPKKSHTLHFRTKSFSAEAVHFDSKDTLLATIHGKGLDLDNFDNTAKFSFE